MTVGDSATHIHCQSCGARWPLDDERHMFYFKPRQGGGVEEQYESPKDIADAGATMVGCPKCPQPRIDEATFEGDRNPDRPGKKRH